MKRHGFIATLVLASFVVGSVVPEDTTAIGARDTNIVQQPLMSIDFDATGPLSVLSEAESSDEALESGGDQWQVSKKSKRHRSSRSSKKKKNKKKNQKNKGKKSKASPTKTQNQ